MIGDIIGGIANAVAKPFEIDAARKTRNKTLDVEKQQIAAQTAAANKSLSLEERMVRIAENAALAASQPGQQSPLTGIAPYLPWIVGAVGAYFLLRKR